MTLQFYEKVVVIKSDKFPEFLGRTGHVLGISEENGIVSAYAISFPGKIEGYMFEPSDLQGTGETADRTLFYEGESVRVRVKDGKGELAD